MFIQWTSHLHTLEEREAFQDMVKGSAKVLDRLREICEHTLSSVDRNSEEDFDSPSWAQKMAFNMGQRKALQDVIKLVTINDE